MSDQELTPKERRKARRKALGYVDARDKQVEGKPDLTGVQSDAAEYGARKNARKR